MHQSTTCCRVLCYPAGNIKENDGQLQAVAAPRTVPQGSEASSYFFVIVCSAGSSRAGKLASHDNRNWIAGRQQHIRVLKLFPAHYSVMVVLFCDQLPSRESVRKAV